MLFVILSSTSGKITHFGARLYTSSIRPNADRMVANNPDRNWIQERMYKQQQPSLKLNIQPSVCEMPLLPFLCMLIRKWQSGVH